MSELKRNIIHLLENNPGLTDRELTDAIRGRRASPQYINQNCRYLESNGTVLRRKREDGLIGNWLRRRSEMDRQTTEIPEKKIKHILESYLTSHGWDIKVNWGNNHGLDIEARLGNDRWIIEVKGSGDYNPMRLNFFHAVLGEILQRMDDPNYKYSIALPDMELFRRLWERLPALAKSRLGVTALFVNLTGSITELD
jgi:hypothetical protein